MTYQPAQLDVEPNGSPCVLEVGRHRLPAPVPVVRDADCDRGRVDPARERGPDRDVGTELEPHRVEERLAHGRDCVTRRLAGLEAPVAREP
jgi:hypothetical protein